MKSFYEVQDPQKYALQSHQVMVGMRIASHYCREWCRAEVVSRVNSAGKVKLFFIDFGTMGYSKIQNCKMLLEDYAVIPKQAIRAGLYGIKPVRNCRLWSLSITQSFVTLIRNKLHEIEIVKYHEHEDFYEFLLYDTDGLLVNDKYVSNQLADRVGDYEFPPCLSYPSFKILETLVYYPTFEERYLLLKNHGVDFNEFEEKNFPLMTNTLAFETELSKLLSDERFVAVKKAFKKIHALP